MAARYTAPVAIGWVLERRLNTGRDGGRGIIACTQAQHWDLGGLQVASPSCGDHAGRGEPATGAERFGEARFEHGCDETGAQAAVTPGGAVVERWPGSEGRNPNVRDRAHEQTLYGSGGRPGNDRRRVANTARTGIHDPPIARPPSPLLSALHANRRLLPQSRATPVRSALRKAGPSRRSPWHCATQERDY